MVSVVLFPRLGKGKQDPLPGPERVWAFGGRRLRLGPLGGGQGPREIRPPLQSRRRRGCTGAESQGRKEVWIN